MQLRDPGQPEEDRAVTEPRTPAQRVAKHRKLLAAQGIRYRSVLVHDDDVPAVIRYAANKLKRRQKLEQK